MLSVIYYDKGIDIVKPLEAYCSGITCNQNAYQTEVVTNDEGESQIGAIYLVLVKVTI